MKVSMILAVDKNCTIGKENGDLPWYISEDMAVFIKHTRHKSILMGRKTWASLRGPLPKRLNMVMTTDKDELSYQGANKVECFAHAINMAKAHYMPELVIIGGKQLYESVGIREANQLLVTVIDNNYAGDVKIDIPIIKDLSVIAGPVLPKMSMADIEDTLTNDGTKHQDWKLVDYRYELSDELVGLHFFTLDRVQPRVY